MHKDIRPLLNAFLDNELHGTRLLEMKLHLASCQACREELKDLRRVSDLLQAAPAPDFMPAERFVSNLTLSLPRRTQRDHPSKPDALAWWLIPVGLLAAWIFVRTVFTLTGMLTLADTTGLLGNASNWLGAGQETVWFKTVMDLSGGQVDGVQSDRKSVV
jgi:anti-sigma factor RsiW